MHQVMPQLRGVQDQILDQEAMEATLRVRWPAVPAVPAAQSQLVTI